MPTTTYYVKARFPQQVDDEMDVYIDNDFYDKCFDDSHTLHRTIFCDEDTVYVTFNSDDVMTLAWLIQRLYSHYGAVKVAHLSQMCLNADEMFELIKL